MSIDKTVDGHQVPSRLNMQKVDHVRKFAAAFGYCSTATFLTVSNTHILRTAKLVKVQTLLLAQQLFVAFAASLAHRCQLVKLNRPALPHPIFLLVVLSFIFYVVSSLYAQSAIDLPLYVTLRKTQILITILLEYLIRGQKLSTTASIGITLTLCGALLMGMCDFRGNPSGYIVCITCNIFGSLYLTALAKHKSIEDRMDSANMSFQTALYLIFFAVCWVAVAGGVRQQLESLTQDPSILLSVVLAGMMNISVIINTRVNSPLTQSVCSSLKDVCVVLIGAFLTPISLNPFNITGFLLTFVGTVVYSLATELQFHAVTTRFFTCPVLSTARKILAICVLLLISQISYTRGIFLHKARAVPELRLAMMGSCMRGTGVAMFDYATMLQSSHVLTNLWLFCVGSDEETISWMLKHFEEDHIFHFSAWPQVHLIDTVVDELSITHLYMLKAGHNDGLVSSVAGVQNLVHSVFDARQPHGQIYAKISHSVPGDVPVVPHMINFQPADINELHPVRSRLNIPNEALVLCRYGGRTTFDVEFVHALVDEMSFNHHEIFFLFMNTDKFCCSDRVNVIFLPGSSDKLEKQSFVESCDAMLHARKGGETFGLAVGEFSIMNKPVITYNSSDGHRHHIDILGDKGILYDDHTSLERIIMNFSSIRASREDWIAYQQFSPARVLRTFVDVFLPNIVN